MHEFRVKGRENEITVWVDSKTNEYTDVVVLMGENKEPIKRETMLECKELLDKIVKEKCIIDEYKHIGTRFRKLYILAEKDTSEIMWKKKAFILCFFFYKKCQKYIDYGTETEVSAPLNRKFNIFTKFSMRGFETNFYKRNKYVLLCILPRILPRNFTQLKVINYRLQTVLL